MGVGAHDGEAPLQLPWLDVSAFDDDVAVVVLVVFVVVAVVVVAVVVAVVDAVAVHESSVVVAVVSRASIEPVEAVAP